MHAEEVRCESAVFGMLSNRRIWISFHRESLHFLQLAPGDLLDLVGMLRLSM